MFFSKLGSRELPRYRNKKLLTTYFFTGHTLFKTLLFYNYYFPPLSDPQDADTDSDIDNASERKTKSNDWQHFMHKKLVSNFYGMSLSLPFFFVFGGLEQSRNLQ